MPASRNSLAPLPQQKLISCTGISQVDLEYDKQARRRPRSGRTGRGRQSAVARRVPQAAVNSAEGAPCASAVPTRGSQPGRCGGRAAAADAALEKLAAMDAEEAADPSGAVRWKVVGCVNGHRAACRRPGNGGLRTASNLREHLPLFRTGSHNAPFRDFSVLHPPYVAQAAVDPSGSVRRKVAIAPVDRMLPLKVQEALFFPRIPDGGIVPMFMALCITGVGKSGNLDESIDFGPLWPRPPASSTSM